MFPPRQLSPTFSTIFFVHVLSPESKEISPFHPGLMSNGESGLKIQTAPPQARKRTAACDACVRLSRNCAVNGVTRSWPLLDHLKIAKNPVSRVQRPATHTRNKKERLFLAIYYRIKQFTQLNPSILSDHAPMRLYFFPGIFQFESLLRSIEALAVANSHASFWIRWVAVRQRLIPAAAAPIESRFFVPLPFGTRVIRGGRKLWYGIIIYRFVAVIAAAYAVPRAIVKLIRDLSP